MSSSTDKEKHSILIKILAKARNSHQLSDRISCYDEAFRIDDVYWTSNLFSNEWVVQFVKDVFGSFEEGEKAFFLCSNQFRRLFIDLDYDLSPKILEKLAPWLLKEGLAYVKKLIGNPAFASKAMEAWGVALKVLGQQTLCMSEKANICISVFPTAIKSPNLSLAKEAFRAWKMLVKVFAKDPNWSTAELSQEKYSRVFQRLELVMKALKYKNVPEVAPEVFDCWWYCCISLGPRLVHHFEDVGHSLMRYCTGGIPKYLSVNESFEVLYDNVASQLNTEQLVSLMNPKLDANRFSRIQLPAMPALYPKLVDLLESFICESPDLLSEPGFCCFVDVNLLASHAQFAIQCIRFVDKMCTDKDSLGERIPNLFNAIYTKLSTLLIGYSMYKQLTLFLAQFVAWLGESTLSTQILLLTIDKISINIVIDQIASDDWGQQHAKFLKDIKESFCMLETKLLADQASQSQHQSDDGMLDSLLQTRAQLEITEHPTLECEAATSSLTVNDTSSQVEVVSLRAICDVQQETSSDHQELLPQPELTPTLEKAAIDESSPMRPFVGGLPTKIPTSPQKHISQVEESPLFMKSNGGEQQEEPMMNVNDNAGEIDGALEIDESPDTEGEEEQRDLAIPEKVPKSTPIIEQQKSEENSENGHPAEGFIAGGKEMESDVGLTEIARKQQDTPNEDQETTQSSVSDNEKSTNKEKEQQNEEKTENECVEKLIASSSPMRAIGNGSPPKAARSPQKVRTPPSILRKADSPGSRKARRVQFKTGGDDDVTEGAGAKISSSPYPKRHLTSIDEAVPLGVSPSKRAMNAFGQAFHIGQSTSSAGTTPMRRAKAGNRNLQVTTTVPISPAKIGRRVIPQSPAKVEKGIITSPARREVPFGDSEETAVKMREAVRKRVEESFGALKQDIIAKVDAMLDETRQQILDTVMKEIV